MVTKVKEINRTVARDLSKELEEVIAKTLTKYGLGVRSKGGSLGISDVTLKYNIYLTNGNGENASKEKGFASLAKSFDLNCEYGYTFKDKRTTLKVTGISPGRYKFPVDLVNVDTGKTMKCPVSYVNRMILMNKSI